MKNVHNELISVLKSQIPQEENPAEVIVNLLSVSKEGAYRRLRGDIQFSLDEAIIIAKHLGISLDNLIEIDWNDKYTFHIMPFTINPTLKEYHQTLTDIMDSYNYVKDDPNSYSYIVSKVFSPTFYFKYKEFSKFVIFKWIYLHQNGTKYSTFSDVKVPAAVEDLYSPFISAAFQVQTTYILNGFMFSALANDLYYLLRIKLLTKEDIEILKTQIIMIINDLEETASRGYYKNGAKVNIYIADNHFDTSYHYLNGKGFEACGIGVYGLNFLSCLNPKIAQDQKIWIESLINHSTSVTQCGEAQRLAFFNKQRKIFNDINI